MTKLLVLSDSHGGRTAIERVLMKESKNIDALIFLGDGLRDLELALTLYPKLRAYSVAGNCDYGALEPTDGLAAFDGKKNPEEYEAELAKLKGDMQAQAEGFAFDNALNTAILGAKGRSVKAVRALLDLDALKGSKDRSTDISKALEEAAKANPWAFGEAEEGGAGSVHVSSGKEHGTPPAGDVDPVTAAFKAMNPDINIE